MVERLAIPSETGGSVTRPKQLAAEGKKAKVGDWPWLAKAGHGSADIPAHMAIFVSCSRVRARPFPTFLACHVSPCQC